MCPASFQSVVLRFFFFASQLLLCPFFPLFKASRCQAVALSPVVESCFLVAPQTTLEGTVAVRRALALQHLVQDPGDEPPHLRHRQCRRPDFFPAWSPASGTRSPTARAFDGDANPPKSAPGSRPSPPPPWHASGI